MKRLDEASENGAAVRLALARHQRRRQQGIPTLSVLVGSREAAIVTWQGWVGAVGWPPSAPASWPQTSEAGGGPPSSDSPGAAMLYLCPPSAETSADRVRLLSGAMERLSRMLVTQSPTPGTAALALAVEAADAESYLCDAPYSRAKAIFAEGMVHVPESILHGFSHADAKENTAPTPAPNEDPHKAGEAEAEAEDRARSEAERFLFNLLDQRPETAGLFELNARLGFCFGPMPAEVDLLAASLRLAVEIDGFHHFSDPERYRRDRRKDALLQKQGYLVLRFLAEDVVVRAEDILSEIRAAVAFRRATR